MVGRNCAKLLNLPSAINVISVRYINMINRKRFIKGQAPRTFDLKLNEGPDFSFMDGRGFAPLTMGQRRRYLRDKYFAEQIVKYMKEFELAKQLKPENQKNKDSLGHQSEKPPTPSQMEA